MSRVTERYLQKAAHALRCLRRRRPLIHELTNFVSMNDCANITLAVGAKPVMARALPEVAETAAAADSLLLNLGTLQESTVQSMHAAAAAFPLSPRRLTAKAAASDEESELTKLLPIRIAVKTSGIFFFKYAMRCAFGSFFLSI